MTFRRTPRIVTDDERRRNIDEVLSDAVDRTTPEVSGRRTSRAPKIPDSHRAPLTLLLDLMGAGMSTVPGNAWKIICYFAAKQVRAELNTRVRTSVTVSLEEFSTGIPRGMRGTGLSRSSVTAAVHDAVDSGLLRRERRHASNGGDLATEYEIAWEKVAELTRARLRKR